MEQSFQPPGLEQSVQHSGMLGGDGTGGNAYVTCGAGDAGLWLRPDAVPT